MAGCTGKKETDKQPTSLQTLELHGKVKRMTVIKESKLDPDRFSCDFRQTEDYRVEYEHAALESYDVFLSMKITLMKKVKVSTLRYMTSMSREWMYAGIIIPAYRRNISVVTTI